MTLDRIVFPKQIISGLIVLAVSGCTTASAAGNYRTSIPIVYQNHNSGAADTIPTQTSTPTLTPSPTETCSPTTTPTATPSATNTPTATPVQSQYLKAPGTCSTNPKLLAEYNHPAGLEGYAFELNLGLNERGVISMGSGHIYGQSGEPAGIEELISGTLYKVKIKLDGPHDIYLYMGASEQSDGTDISTSDVLGYPTDLGNLIGIILNIPNLSGKTGVYAEIIDRATGTKIDVLYDNGTAWAFGTKGVNGQASSIDCRR